MKHLEPWFEVKATPVLAGTDDILKLFWCEAQGAIEGLPEVFPEGHAEAEHGASRVQSFRDKAARFACLRVVRYARESASRLHITECVLAHPATRPAVVGLRAWCVQPGGGRISSGRAIPELWGDLEKSGFLEPAADDKPLPYFDQLVALVREGEQVTGGGAGPGTEEDAEREELVLERDYYRDLAASQDERLRQMQAKLREVQQALAQKGTLFEEIPQEDPLPQELAYLPMWAQAHSEQVVILPRAFSGAKRSLYHDDADIYQALDFLAGPYWAFRAGRLEPEAYQKALHESGLKIAGSASYITATTERSSYFVQYRKRQCLLDWHIVKGGGRDPRYCLRIYFFWDGEEQKVVIGWLPTHLDNSLT